MILTQQIESHPDHPPYPQSKSDRDRWEFTRLAKRILRGAWKYDLKRHMDLYLPPSRSDAWGPPSVSLNTFRSVIDQISQLYHRAPIIRNEEADEADLVAATELFRRHAHLQRLTVGLRECLVRVHWNDPTHVSDGGVSLRIVTPDVAVVEDDPKAPGVPVYIKEAVKRKHPHTPDRDAWTWDVWDIRDPSAPSFRIEDDKGRDITDIFLPEEAVGRYDWVDEDGTPYLPWILYHAQDTGDIWDPYFWSELLWGTMDVGLCWTFWLHAVKDCSWDQKYGINVDLVGATTEGEGANSRSRVPTDPASILLFRQRTTEGASSLGSFSRPIDPKNIGDAVLAYQKTVSQSAGLDPADVQTKSGAESGVAITIRRDAVRRLQASFEDEFRAADTELLRKFARVSNTFGGTSLPLDGWMITYHSLPRSSEEVKSTLEEVRQLLDIGLITKRDALRKLNPELTEEQLDLKMTELAELATEQEAEQEADGRVVGGQDAVSEV